MSKILPIIGSVIGTTIAFAVLNLAIIGADVNWCALLIDSAVIGSLIGGSISLGLGRTMPVTTAAGLATAFWLCFTAFFAGVYGTPYTMTDFLAGTASMALIGAMCGLGYKLFNR